MKRILDFGSRLSNWMDNVGGSILVIMMMLTVIDIALRISGRPITGTYELVALAGAMVVGFAVPQTTQENGHIGVDLLIQALSRSGDHDDAYRNRCCFAHFW